MPPKRGHRSKISSSSNSLDGNHLIPGASLDPIKPALPHIPTKHSFAYGSQGATVLPRQLVAQESNDLLDIADSIERGRKQAEARQEEEAREQEAAYQAGRKNRGPSPDEEQLFDQSVASSSPLLRPEQSTPTPSPPRMHTLSSSPRRPNGLYPFRDDSSGIETPSRGSSPLEDLDQDPSVDSFSVERDVYDSDLLLTQPGHGTNISAPPRRISGLASIHDTAIEEEPLPDAPAVAAPNDVNSAQQQQVPRKSTSLWNQFWRELYTLTLAVAVLSSIFAIYTFRDDIVEISRKTIGSISLPSFSLPSFSPTYVNVNASDPRTVRLLTNQVGELDAQVSTLTKDLKDVRVELANAESSMQPIQVHRKKKSANFFSPALGAVVNPQRSTPTAGKRENWFQKLYRWCTNEPTAHPPRTALVPWQEFGDCWCTVPREDNGIKSQLTVSLGRKIVPEEVVVDHIPYGGTLEPEVTPRRMELWARFVGDVPDNPAASRYAWFSPNQLIRRFPFSFFPFSSPSSSSSSQVEDDATTRIPASASPPVYSYTTSGRFLLHETILNILRKVYRGEPEKAYVSSLSDDPFLDPSQYGKNKNLQYQYYRLGRFEYDLHSRRHVQSFPLEAIIDLPGIRSDNVILRTKTNYGGNHTCLYWVKLYGHM